MAKASNLRSWLIVDPVAALDPGALTDADRIVVDLGTSGSLARAPELCAGIRATLADRPLAFLLPSMPDRWEAAMAFAVEEKAEAVFATVEGGAAVQRLDVLLRLHEARLAQPAGETGIVALADAAGILAAAGFARCSRRLRALGWALDCDRHSPTADLARATVALASLAAGIDGIDAASPETDMRAFREECLMSAAAGLAGKLCRFPQQVAIVNDVFGNQPPAPGGRVISNVPRPQSA